MASELIQRKPQAKNDTADAVGEIQPQDVTPPVAVSTGPPNRAYRRSKHPEIFISIATTFICAILLWFFTRRPSGPALFEIEALRLYNGQKNAPLYLAILGEVFDVTEGRKLYDPEHGYGGFIGRDASRAFVTGDFKADLNDDIADFNPQQFKALVEWRDFYRKHKVYTFKGQLVGRFYNQAGKPTRFLRKVEEQAAQAKSDEELQQEAEAQWKSCSVRWTESEGGSVWCEDNAYPRKVTTQLPGGKPNTRCVCFEEIGWSDIRQVYPDCPPDAHKCKV